MKQALFLSNTVKIYLSLNFKLTKLAPLLVFTFRPRKLQKFLPISEYLSAPMQAADTIKKFMFWTLRPPHKNYVKIYFENSKLIPRSCKFEKEISDLN